MSIAGIRGWRLTTGTATGLSLALCCEFRRAAKSLPSDQSCCTAWAALVNSVNQTGISDILFTIIIMAFFFLGFVFGVWEFARVGAITCLAIIGGLAFGIRIALLRENDLLFPNAKFFGLNWALAGIFATISVVSLILHQRMTIVSVLLFMGVLLLLTSIIAYIL